MDLLLQADQDSQAPGIFRALEHRASHDNRKRIRRKRASCGDIEDKTMMAEASRPVISFPSTWTDFDAALVSGDAGSVSGLPEIEIVATVDVCAVWGD